MQPSIGEKVIGPATPDRPHSPRNRHHQLDLPLEVVLERNKFKVAVIQESKLSPKSKNPCIQNYTTVRKDRSHGQGGGLLIFINRSITFSKKPSSPESLSDPHLEEFSIKAELGNRKLIISNVYIPRASS